MNIKRLENWITTERRIEEVDKVHSRYGKLPEDRKNRN
jgi:hypothetical protein